MDQERANGQTKKERKRETASIDATAERLARWQSAVLAGDSEARDEIAAWAVPRLRAILQREFRKVDAALVAEAVEDAVLRYLRQPQAWEPRRSALLTFLATVARSQLLTRLGRERRRRQRERAFAETVFVPPLTAAREDKEDLLKTIGPKLARTTAERRFLAVWLSGERRTEVYGEALEILDMPVSRQREEVKRMKDRLAKRARRLVERR